MSLTEITQERDDQHNVGAPFAKVGNEEEEEGKQLLTKDGDDVEKTVSSSRSKVASDKDHVTDHVSGKGDGLWSIAVGISAFLSQVFSFNYTCILLKCYTSI